MPNAEKPELDEAYQQMINKYSFDESADDVKKEACLCKQREINSFYQAALPITMSNEQYRLIRQKFANQKAEFDAQSPNIINHINNRNFTQAEAMLNCFELTNYAKWHYIYACLRISQGWMNEAYNHAKIAYQLEPNEPVYAQTFFNMQNMKNGKKLTPGQLGAIITGGTLALVGTACVCLFVPDHLYPNFHYFGTYSSIFGAPFYELCAEPCNGCCGEDCACFTTTWGEDDSCNECCNEQCDICCGGIDT